MTPRRRHGESSRRGLIALPLALILVTGVAWGYWTTGSSPGGGGASAATMVNQGATPTANATGSSITVGWAASTLSTGLPVSGYLVKRYDASSLASQPILSACAGTLTATTCTENAVPTGQWVYTVTPVFATNWQGAESLKSNAVLVDGDPPINALTLSSVTGAFLNASTVFYRGVALGSFTLTNAASDVGSGPASSSTAALTGTTTGWSHTASTVSTPAGGPYTSNPFSWTAGTVGGPSEVVTARDVAGNSAATTLAFLNDSTAPTAGTISYIDGLQPGQSVAVAFTIGTDAGSGIATRQLQRASATMTLGLCGIFSGFSNVGPDSPNSPYSDTSVFNSTCYKYRYVVTDRVGNQDIATSPNVAKINFAGSSVPLGTAATYSVLGGTGVASTGLTTLTGDLGVSPSTSITGFPPGVVNGAVHAGDAAAAQAQADLLAAYTDAASRAPSGTFAGDQNGQTFTPGVWKSTPAFALTGTLTLDAQGDPNAVFIFQIGAALNTAAGSNVVLVNGAQASRVYWQVLGAAGIGATASFSGTIMAFGAITLGAGATLNGHALATGLVTLAANPVQSDSTSPTNALSLGVVTGGAYLSGSTVFYRGGTAGSFTLINAVSDPASGPGSSATAPLAGTAIGWTHTASKVSTPVGGPYTSNVFSWGAATTSAPTETIWGRDVAGNIASTTLSYVNDSTPPTAGSITYPDAYQSSRSVSLTFTTGTESGSGIATRRLQRATAPLTAGTCGTFSSFANIGVDSPTSPYVDLTVGGGNCYQYRYVVADRVGNQDIATSANVAKLDYATAVNGTAGLLSQWRVGEPATSLTSIDSFTGTSGTALTSHTGELGATWAHQAGAASASISNANRARDDKKTGQKEGFSVDYTTATPPSADYSVGADLYVKSILAGDTTAVIGRLDTSSTAFYMARRDVDSSSWLLMKYSGGTATTLSSAVTSTLAVGQTYRVRLTMVGSQLSLFVNGVLTVSATDATITAAGKAGIMQGAISTSPLKSDVAGAHLDNFQVTPSTYPRAVDSKGSNPGDYLNGVTIGVAGALSGDTNTAAQFDGANDYIQMAGTTGIPVGAASRSVETWFKTTSAARQVLFGYGSAVNGQQFGLSLNAGGAAMTARVYGTADKIFTLTSAVNNGSWHHVVETYDGTSITLYIDGTALAPQAVALNTVMDSTGFVIGAVTNSLDANFGGYFNGSLDEVSLYTTALSQATVTNHYQLGTADVTGPTDGFVDANGLVGTGSRYSTSTTLALNLNKGTDASGLAATGNTLLRATATLTSTAGADGVCGTFGTYSLVAGGTDPVSPKSDTVTDQACYSYHYVVLDALGNATTYASPNIKVDTTAPAAAALAFSTFTNTFWAGSASTIVYYRSAAATGSFRATGTATDAASGIVSFTYPALGTNWTSTPGALGVNTYSWSGVPAAPATKNVTATNNATGVSANSPFTLTADDIAPTAGTVTYPNATQSGTSVTVSFTTGTDGGSGLGTRLLQRASATLTGTSCGTFGGFSTVLNGTNPTSPLVDTVVAGNCYKYQYVVSDNVGNLDTAISANVVKVPLSYFDAILGTTGLLSYWRLGETSSSNDTFTDTAGTVLSAHVPEQGTSWIRWTGDTITGFMTNANRLRKDSLTGGVGYYTAAVPTTPDYLVEADVVVKSIAPLDHVGVIGRWNLAGTGAGTYYTARYETSTSTWQLLKLVNGTSTPIGTNFSQTLVAGTTYRLGLDMNGTTIRLLVDGVQRISVVDATITAAGRAGVRLGASGDTAPESDTQGLQLDNFYVTPALGDSKGTNPGDYLYGPFLGATGAIARDSNTAAQFDGANDYAAVGRQISDDFSIEFWFKSAQGIGTAAQWSQGAGLVDADIAGTSNDFGVSLRSDGCVVAGVGGGVPGDTSIVSTTCGYNNNSWHQVVFTRTKSTGAMQLYVDGVAKGSATGSTLSLTSAPAINFGRLASAGSFYYLGSLDEVAVYSAVLSQATVTAHFAAAQ